MKKFIITKPNPKKHKKQLAQIFAMTFPFPNYFKMYDHATERYFYHSHYDWENSRIGIIGEEIVSHFGVWNYQMRVGNARLKTAGIGAVLTHNNFRKHGYLTKTANAALESVKSAGYDFSILFGIRNFYHKFGYARAWNNSHYIISLDNLPKEKPEFSIKKMRKAHYPEMEKLYNKVTKKLTGTAVRPTYSLFPKDELGYYWTDKKGNLAGYLFVKINPNELDCVEAIGDVEQILRVTSVIAKKNLKTTIRFSHLHYNLPIAEALRRRNCRVEINYEACGGPMAKIINLKTTMQNLLPELSVKINESLIPKYKGELLVSDSNEKVFLKIANGNVSVIENSKTKNFIKGNFKLAELLLGTDDPRETAKACGIKFGGEGKMLAEILFPNRHPQQFIRDFF